MRLRQAERELSYEVTFQKGELPPVEGFWSLTMYDPEHFFAPNALKRYALGTKNKTVKYKRRWQPDHLSREQVAWPRQGGQLASGAQGTIQSDDGTSFTRKWLIAVRKEGANWRVSNFSESE